MPKFRKKPIVIEAEQFRYGETPWPEGVHRTEIGFRVDTPEGEAVVRDGDWIIKGIKGERYPCNPDIFEATYEAVEQAPASSAPCTAADFPDSVNPRA